jgi:hypothetical protein
MATKTHNVKGYTYFFTAALGAAESLHLWADLTGSQKLAYIRFVDDDSPRPAPTFTPGFTSCTATFRRSALPGLIDMLRNESPVSLLIGDGPLIWIYAGVLAPEPVGEGES